MKPLSSQNIVIIVGRIWDADRFAGSDSFPTLGPGMMREWLLHNPEVGETSAVETGALF
jgi:hypothetical protein